MPINAINQFYQAIIDKEVERIHASYVPDEDTYVVLEGPRLTTLGFSKIASGWVDFCDSGLTLESIDWLEGPREEIRGEMAWLAGVIKLAVAVQGRRFERTFRASFVLLQDDGQWRIRHEHVSAALADPYGIGDWLKKK